MCFRYWICLPRQNKGLQAISKTCKPFFYGLSFVVLPRYFKKIDSKITTREEEQGISLKFPFRELIDHYCEHIGQYNESSLSIEDIILVVFQKVC